MLVVGDERECGTNTLLDTYIDDPDTLCPGPLVGEGDCSGTITDTDADITCSSSFGVVPGCTATDTSSCTSTPVLPATWVAVKARYE